MTRRRSSTSRCSVRLDPVKRALFMFCATVSVVDVFGSIGLLAMLLSTAVILLSMGGAFQLVVSQRIC